MVNSEDQQPSLTLNIRGYIKKLVEKNGIKRSVSSGTQIFEIHAYVKRWWGVVVEQPPGDACIPFCSTCLLIPTFLLMQTLGGSGDGPMWGTWVDFLASGLNPSQGSSADTWEVSRQIRGLALSLSAYRISNWYKLFSENAFNETKTCMNFNISGPK